MAVNSELIGLYWELGKSIVERQEKSGWRDAVLERLSKDLAESFPEMKGFSQRNLYRMRTFYRAYRAGSEFLPQAVAKIPWGHNIVILDKIKDLRKEAGMLRNHSIWLVPRHIDEHLRHAGTAGYDNGSAV